MESNTKLVFEIKEELTSLRQELINKGVALREIKSFPGFDYLLCDGEDPEGNVFQLAQKLIKITAIFSHRVKGVICTE